MNDADWVLIPGTLCTEAVFAPMLDHLGVAPERRHTIAPTQPRVEDYAEPLQRAVTGGQIVCGFSLGALIASHNLPALGNAQAVILLAANPLPDAPENRERRNAARDRVLSGDARGWVADSWDAFSPCQNPALQEMITTMAEASAHLIPAQTELALSRPGAARLITETETPLLFLTGSRDQLTPAAPLEDLISQAPLAHLNVIDGAGHYALLERPEEVSAAIAAFLEAQRMPTC